MTDKKNNMISTVFVIVFILISFSMQNDIAAQYTVTACDDCHTLPPADGTRNAATGAVVGSHSVAEHLASTCTNCHIDNGTPASAYPQGLAHREGLIEMINNIHSQSGAFYDKDESGTQTGADLSFAQSNAPTLGSCKTTFCHGTTSATWGTDLSANDNCTICHGAVTVDADGSAAEYKRAPGADGTGVDTAGQTGTYSGGVSNDPQVGAHRAHIESLNNYSSDIACDQCHTVPATVGEAGHNDDALPAEVNGNWGNIATGSQEGPGTTPNWNGTTCSNTYCHDGTYFKNEWGPSGIVPPWTSSSYLIGDGSDCLVCHGWPPSAPHDSSTDCSQCHTHVNADDISFASPALHVNGVVNANVECTSCHNSAKTGAPNVYEPRQITGAGGDFVRASRHVSDGTTGEIVTSYDCAVCHAEGDVTAINAGTGWTSALHNDGSTANNRMVNLRNVDNYAGATYDFNKNVTDSTMRDDLDSFCMGCHDSDGASTIAVDNNDPPTGLFLNDTSTIRTVRGASNWNDNNATVNLRPFNSYDNLRNTHDTTATGGGAIGTFRTRTYGRVLNVKDQFNSGNATGKNWASHHNLNQFAKRYGTTYLNANVWTGYTTNDGSSLDETVGLHCSDCHLNEVNAHGAVNSWYMLCGANTASCDDVAPMTIGDVEIGSEVMCIRCHNADTYATDANNHQFSRLDHTRRSTGSRIDEADEYPFGIQCMACHGGYSSSASGAMGAIHGTNESYFPLEGGTSSKRYRFMSGATMRFYSPNESSYSGESDWVNGDPASCYTIGGADTWAGGCTEHNPSDDTADINFTGRQLEY